MGNINEQLNPAYGWSSGRRMSQGAPHQGLRRSHINDGVLDWVPGVTGVAIRIGDSGSPWFYRILDVPGFEPSWQPCRYANAPQFETIGDAIRWAKTKKFNGLNIID